jgi:hypothetical protein
MKVRKGIVNGHQWLVQWAVALVALLSLVLASGAPGVWG